MLALLALLAFHASAYEVIHQPCQMGSVSVVAIRSNGDERLVVNPSTLQTAIVNQAKLSCAGGEERGSLYLTKLDQFTSSSRAVNANEGARAFSAPCAGAKEPIALTMDLCPAGEADASRPHRPLDTGYFDELEAFAVKTSQPVHVTLFISGQWIARHPLLAERLRRGWPHLVLTFANHSDTHPYTRGLPYRSNFMTQMSRGQFRAEVLRAEQQMWHAGLKPSVFFRFPGLMSNADELAELRSLGLIPVGTSAWTAVNGAPDRDYAGFDFPADQAPRAGRIVLTHANGNEETGVRGKNGFLTYLRMHSPTLIDLREAVRCSK